MDARCSDRAVGAAHGGSGCLWAAPALHREPCILAAGRAHVLRWPGRQSFCVRRRPLRAVVCATDSNPAAAAHAHALSAPCDPADRKAAMWHRRHRAAATQRAKPRDTASRSQTASVRPRGAAAVAGERAPAPELRVAASACDARDVRGDVHGNTRVCVTRSIEGR